MAADALLRFTTMDRLRVLCMGLPEAEEVEAWDVPTFRVRNRFSRWPGQEMAGCRFPARRAGEFRISS